MDVAAAADLFAELAYSTPSLPHAACRGHAELYDSEDPGGVEAAKDICRYCPELARCAAWAATVSPHKLFGVVAGHPYNIPPKKKRKKIA